MTPYTRYRDYSQFQSDNPDTDLNGSDLDTDFDRLKTTTDSLEDAIEDVRRADGELANDSVGVDQLQTEVIDLMGDWTPRGDWVTATAYSATNKDIVRESNKLYACLTAHTSGTFATDLAAGKWMQLGPATSAASVANTPAGNIAATTVQDAIDELDDEKQPVDDLLTAIAALSMVADRYIYGTGADAVALGTITAAGRAILDDANAAAQLVTLGALPTAGGTMTGAIVLPGNPSLALQAAPKQYVDALVGSAFAGAPGGRLTLATGTPVTTADQTAKTTVYYTPYINNLLPIYDGSAWTASVITEMALALDSNAGHTGYHAANKPFDLFVFNDSGTLRLATGPAWTNATTRAEDIARVAGRWVNDTSIQLRWGTGTSDLSTVAANLATYVGTFYTYTAGQIEDTLEDRNLWNAYNRVLRGMRRIEATNSWTYSANSFQQANASTDNQLGMVRGLDEDAVSVGVLAICGNSTATARQAIVGVGLDSVTTPSGQRGIVVISNAGYWTVSARYEGFPGLGFHYMAWLEEGAGSDTQTWLGDNGATVVQSGISGMVMA